jgi:acyl transferase domain-containing protein
MTIKLDVAQLVHKIRAGEISPQSGMRAVSSLRDEIHRRTVLRGGAVTDLSPEELLENALIEVMSEVLALEQQEIDPEANISEYGFDSITLAEFASKIVCRYPFMHLEPSTFLDLPTVSGLASFLAKKYDAELGVEKLSAEQLEVEIEIDTDRENTLLHKRQPVRDTDVAIIGMAGRFPGAENVAEFWKNLLEEKVLLSQIPPNRWDWRESYGDPHSEDGKTDCCYGAFLQDVSRFDPLHFGISPAEAELLDPQHRIALELAWEALENAGYCRSALHDRDVGVFIGVEKQDYKELLNKSQFELDPYTNAGNTHSMLVNRISYFFNWRGPSVAVDTACSSSLAAIEQACNSLRSGRVEMALAGGINLLLTKWIFVVNRKLGMLTNEPVMRPFDRNASGHLNGEGAALVVLKKLSRAIADDDFIYGVIRGISVQHGGRGAFLTAPTPTGHRAVIEDALSEAGLEPKDIDYIESQGTADHTSDKVELKTYQAVFGGARAEPVKIGTAKGNVGHLGVASGVTALIKTLLSFRNDKLPRVLNLENLNWTEDDGEFQCEFVTQTEDWPARRADSSFVPRRAGIHNFGYGGVNAHMIVEEYRARHTPDLEAAANNVIVLSARTNEQLKQSAENLLSFLRNREYQSYGIKELQLPALAYTLQTGREPMDYRMALVVHDLLELEQGLACFCREETGDALLFSGKAHKQKNSSHSEEQGGGLSNPLSQAAAVELARSWIAGEEINWTELYLETKPQKFPLPTYPFAREQYWIPQEGAVPEIDVEHGHRSVISMRSKESAQRYNDAALELLVKGDLKREACLLLKLKPHQIDEERAFVELGFQSQTQAQFARNLSELFGIDLMPESFFSYPSINELSKHVVTRYRAAFETFYKLKTESATRQEDQPAINDGVNQPAVVMSSAKRKRDGVSGEDEPIAVIGMSGRFPGADTTSELWNILAAGKSVISEVPKERWDWRKYFHGPGNAANEIATNRGGFISGIADFDPVFFNLSPREAELIDPRQRLLLQEAWRAFEDAGYAGRRLRGTECGVFIGVEEGEYQKLTGDDGLLTGNHNGILASRISYFLDLKGPSLAINTACSSGLVAVHLACRSLQRGETELALAGAVHLMLFPGIYKQLTRLGMLSDSGQGFTLDERADGIIPGEGVAVLVLKPLSTAIEDRDNIYGVIKGSGLNYKGRTNGITAPNGLSQQRLIEEVYQRCGIRAADIDYVAVHGTGTKLGDSVEVAALTEVFRSSTAETGHCALGSIKANFGHTFAVSGIANVIAVLLSMKHNLIPASLNGEHANEILSASGSPFYVNTTLTQWIPQSEKHRLAAVSAFGISGTNAHVVLGEHALAHESQVNGADEGVRAVIVPLSAKDEERLREYAERLMVHLKSGVQHRDSKVTLKDLAYTLQTGRDAMDCRVAFVVSDVNELVSRLQALLEGTSDVSCFYGRRDKDVDVLQTLGSDEDMQQTIRTWLSTGKLQQVAALWTIGADIDWELFKDGSEKRISLPNYPFARRRCWFGSRKEAVEEIGTAASATVDAQLRTVEPSRSAEAIYATHSPDGRSSRRNGTRLNLQAIEQDLQVLVGEILYLNKSEVDTTKKFIEMGVDSVIGMELVTRLNQNYNLNMSATRLYDYPNIVELAKYIHDALAHRSDVENIIPPSAHVTDDRSLLITQDSNATDSLTRQLREVLKQVTSDALTVEAAEQLITQSLQNGSHTA